MNPLQRVRDGAGRAWFKTKRGTTRTADRVKDGVARGADKARSGALLERARTDRRVAIAWAIAGILVLAWIGWTIYVWTENGSTAGLGVLVSWPAVLVAAAIVATPFVGAGILVRRLRPVADGIAPSAAGDATGTEATAESTAEPNADDSDDQEPGEDEEPDDDETSEEDGPERPQNGVEDDDSGDGSDEDDVTEGADEAAVENK